MFNLFNAYLDLISICYSQIVQVPGKIVVYNQVFENYGQSVSYRTRGAIEAAKVMIGTSKESY